MSQKKTGKPPGEEKLAAENERLRAKVKALESRLEAAADAAGVARDHFIFSVAHGLRTPLSAMTLWIKLLEDQDQPDPAQWREGLEAIRICAKEQQQMIDDLLASSRGAGGKLPASLAVGSKTTK